MPGVVLFGNSWRWATDDLPFPALVNGLLQLTWVAVLSTFLPDIDTSEAMRSSCKYAYTHAVILFVLFCAMCFGFIASVAIFAVSVRGSIWETNKRKYVVYLVPLDMFSFFCTFCCTVVSTALVIDEGAECLAGEEEDDHDPTSVVRAAIAYGWVISFLQVISVVMSYKAFPRLNDSESLVSRRKYLDAMCCMGSFLGEFDEIHNGTGELSNALADVLVNFFGQSHMTLSDLVCSMQLVGHWQDKEREEKVLQLQLTFENPSQETTSVNRSMSAYFVTPPGIAYKNIWNDSTLRRSQAHQRVGVQDIVEATHYMKFAVAAYGAKLYVFASRSWFGGAVYLGGLAAMRSMKSLASKKRLQRRLQKGSKSVDSLEKEGILEFAEIAEEDLLYVSQMNERNNLLPYFIALDHKSRSVVLGIRGTMSIADCLTDVQFDPVAIDEWMESDSCAMPEPGNCRWSADQSMKRERSPGSHAHRGILKSACAILEDLQGHKMLDELLVTGRYTGGVFDGDADPLASSSGVNLMSTLRSYMSGSRSPRTRSREGNASFPLEGSAGAQRGSWDSDGSSELGESSKADRDGYGSAGPSRLGSGITPDGKGDFKGVIFMPKGGITLEPRRPPPAEPVRGDSLPGSGASTPRRKASKKEELKRKVSGIIKGRMPMADGGGEWRLVVTGHSLGAGVAALVALKLKRRFPTLKCWTFAAPGALLSRNVAESMESYCTNLAIGKDWVARLNLRNAYRLWDDLMKASTHCRKPKFTVLSRGLFWHSSLAYRQQLFYAEHELPEEPAEVWNRFCSTRHGNMSEGIVPALSFISPGRTLFLRPEKTGKGHKKITSYEPVWLPAGVLQEEGLLISKRCFADHMPDFALFTMKKLTSKMVGDALAEQGEGVNVTITPEGQAEGSSLDPHRQSESEVQYLRAWATSTTPSTNHSVANASTSRPEIQVHLLDEDSAGKETSPSPPLITPGNSGVGDDEAPVLDGVGGNVISHDNGKASSPGPATAGTSV